MGEYNAGIGLIIFSIGFIALTGILAIIPAIAVELGATPVQNISGGSQFGDVLSSSCEQPRLIQQADGTFDEIGFLGNSISCELTEGSINENVCNGISGCTWENASTVFFFFEKDAFCNGDVYLPDYTEFTNQTNVTFIEPLTVLANPDTVFVRNSNKKIGYAVGEGEDARTDNSIHPILKDQDSCELLGFKWVDISEKSNELAEQSTAGLITSNLIGIFTFQYDFGLDGDSEYWVSVLFYILAIIGIILFYFIIPGIH